MLDSKAIQDAAHALFNAERDRLQINLLSRRYPDMTMDDAYRIQDATIDLHKAVGRSQVGWKIGLTSKVMQRALNIDIPDSGVLLDSMFFDSGAMVPRGRFFQPRVEAEIAFVMKADVTEPTSEAILAATDYVTPSIEILDTRIIRQDTSTGFSRSVLDTISDNAANAGFVLGRERHDPRSVDLRWVGALLKCDDVVEETGLGAAVLGDPLLSIQWLVERLMRYNQTIKAGDIVLSGSFIRIVEAPAGSRFFADFGSFGSVDISFA